MTLPTLQYSTPDRPEGRGTSNARELIGEVFDADEETPLDNGTMPLPAWLGMICDTEDTTAQSGENTVASGFAAHAPRAYSQDGVNWGLLVEPATENLFDEQDLSAWTASGADVATIDGPDGEAASAWRVTDDSAGAVESVLRGHTVNTTTHTISAWLRYVGTYSSRILVWAQNGGALFVQDNVGETEWQPLAATATVTVATANTIINPRSEVAANTGDGDIWGLQLEERAYPTSYIDGTREAGSITFVPECLMRDGVYNLRLKYRPHYAQDEPASDHTLFYLDDDNRAYFDESAGTIVFVVDSVTLTSSALAFSRHQELTVELERTERRTRLLVSGATSGNGEWRDDSVGAIDVDVDLPSQGYLLSTSTGAEEAADLRACIPLHLKSFSQLADERCLVQMDDQPGNRKFRDLMRVLAILPGRIFDMGCVVKNAFDRDVARGKQLDMIGSLVGLTREGFSDARFRVFLEIVAELLLSSSRDGAEWTGMSENILRISRIFIGEAASPIFLRNAPPYDLVLNIPDLTDLTEAGYLARFIRRALFAGVAGHISIAVDSDSKIGSEAVSVPGGTLGSESVAVAGAMINGTAVALGV